MWKRITKSKTRSFINCQNVIEYEIYSWKSLTHETTHIYCYFLDKQFNKIDLFHTKPLSKELLDKIEQYNEVEYLFYLLNQHNKIKKDDKKTFNIIKSFIHI